jgi:hypothetical protein
MSQPPTINTTPAELNGTITGMIITAIVAAVSLVVLIGLVYWANKHPDVKQPSAQQRPGTVHGTAQPTAPRSFAVRLEEPVNSSVTLAGKRDMDAKA